MLCYKFNKVFAKERCYNGIEKVAAALVNCSAVTSLQQYNSFHNFTQAKELFSSAEQMFGFNHPTTQNTLSAEISSFRNLISKESLQIIKQIVKMSVLVHNLLMLCHFLGMFFAKEPC